MENMYIYDTTGIRYDVSTRINGQGGEFFSPERPTNVYMAIGSVSTNPCYRHVFYRENQVMKSCEQRYEEK
mgnify:CR=1 FL=1